MGTLSGFLVGDTPVMAQDLEYRIDAMTSARNSIRADSDPRTPPTRLSNDRGPLKSPSLRLYDDQDEQITNGVRILKD